MAGEGYYNATGQFTMLYTSIFNSLWLQTAFLDTSEIAFLTRNPLSNCILYNVYIPQWTAFLHVTGINCHTLVSNVNSGIA